jgi:hypothetical protein
LNNPITEVEIIKVIQRLKKEKSPGSDNLLNECFIEYNDFFTKYFVKLFNIVFSSGVFPSSWSEGIITPVFKMGYRGITLLSCLSRIFTALKEIPSRFY